MSAVFDRERRLKILWYSDAACHTGFATVTHNVLAHLHERHELHVCGINYHGDPHKYPYPIYPAALGGDVWGVGRYDYLCNAINPDVVVINNDPWNVARFLTADRPWPVVAYLPIDGEGMTPQIGEHLNHLACAIWYTDFGQTVATTAGYTGRSEIIPHGVDTELYRPIPQAEARAKLGIPQDAFIVGNVNQNQLRKRLDLSIQAFAMAYKDGGLGDAWLYLHSVIKGEGLDIRECARYYGVEERMICVDGKTSGRGLAKELMPYVYSSFDVQISTSMGEGWGLTTMEGMACGVPQILPKHSALAEWPEHVEYVDCNERFVMPYGINMVCRVPDPKQLAEKMIRARGMRNSSGLANHSIRDHVCQPQFQWANIADKFESVLESVVNAAHETASTKDAALQAV